MICLTCHRLSPIGQLTVMISLVISTLGYIHLFSTAKLLFDPTYFFLQGSLSTSLSQSWTTCMRVKKTEDLIHSNTISPQTWLNNWPAQTKHCVWVAKPNTWHSYSVIFETTAISEKFKDSPSELTTLLNSLLMIWPMISWLREPLTNT